MNEAMNEVPESDIKSLSVTDSWYRAHTVLKLHGSFFSYWVGCSYFCGKEDVDTYV